MWCRMGGVGARSRKRAGLDYRLVRKHTRTGILGLLIIYVPRIIQTDDGQTLWPKHVVAEIYV